MRSKRAWVAAAVAGMLLSTLWVLQASGAKFSAPAGSTGNSATAAQIAGASSLTATASAVACRITLNWTATPSTWAGGYQVYRGGTLIGTTTGRDTVTYQDESASLKVGLTYSYQVRAYYGSWLSPASNSASATGPALCGGGA